MDDPKPKLLVVYCYYEKNREYLDNFAYFVNVALPWKHPIFDIHYIIVINGKCSYDLSRMSDCKIIYRPNVDYDFGAYNEALHEMNQSKTNNQLDAYDFFFFINTSVRGPILPPYYTGHYLDPFIELFKRDQDVHLVGTSINVLELSPNSNEAKIFRRLTDCNGPFTHVQTQMFGMDRQCMKFLQSIAFFKKKQQDDSTYTDFSAFIAEKEIMMSHLVLRKAGWNIACLVPEYMHKDYRTVKSNFNAQANNGDACYPYACFGRTLHPYELVFPKTNRGLMNNEISTLSIANIQSPHLLRRRS